MPNCKKHFGFIPESLLIFSTLGILLKIFTLNYVLLSRGPESVLASYNIGMKAFVVCILTKICKDTCHWGGGGWGGCFDHSTSYCYLKRTEGHGICCEKSWNIL